MTSPPSAAAMAALREQLAASHGLRASDRRIGAMAERTAKLHATRRELAEQYNLPVEDPRIQQGALAALNQKNWEAKILLGQAVPAGELESYTKIIAQLLGKPPTDLNVRFITDMARCSACGFVAPETPEETARDAARAAKNNPPPVPAAREPSVLPLNAPEPEPEKAETSASEGASPASAPQPTQVPAPVNVIASFRKGIHADPHAPLARRDEPWRSHVEGEQFGYRQFDIPKDF